MSTPPPLRLPDEVRKALEAQRPGLASEKEQLLAAHVRPCVAVTAKRVSEAPLRRGAIARLFGARAAAPTLGATASKFGGVPYCEEEEDWKGRAFLGQIDLAEATAVLPRGASRLSGLLRIDFDAGASITNGLRARWFPSPSAARAVAAAPESCGAWETRLLFRLAWSLPEGNALEALWPDSEWYDYEEFYPAGYNDDGFDEYHRLLGHMSSGLDEPYEFAPPADWPREIGSYDCLLRVTYDNAAGFAWGTNWIYLLVPREDLAQGDLSRVLVTGANS